MRDFWGGVRDFFGGVCVIFPRGGVRDFLGGCLIFSGGRA